MDLSISEQTAEISDVSMKQNDFDLGPKVLFKDICAGNRRQRREKNDSTLQNGGHGVE